jgi:glutathione-independent formaldehyde dehydrogenase
MAVYGSQSAERVTGPGNPAGRVAIIGVWPLNDPTGVDLSLKNGKLAVSWSKFFNKNVSIMMGRDDDKRSNSKLRDMIITGTAKPSRIVSHRLRLDGAPDAFVKFDARKDGYIKIVLKPASR